MVTNIRGPATVGDGHRKAGGGWNPGTKDEGAGEHFPPYTRHRFGVSQIKWKCNKQKKVGWATNLKAGIPISKTRMAAGTGNGWTIAFLDRQPKATLNRGDFWGSGYAAKPPYAPPKLLQSPFK